VALAAGKLRHRVSIEEQVVTVNSYGESETYWAPVADVWAAIEPLSGKEYLAAQQIQSAVSCRIVIRQRDLLPSMRIVYRSKVYNIAAILPDKESGLEYVTILASEDSTEQGDTITVLDGGTPGAEPGGSLDGGGP
jgi:SPP1 family predicted phage head-tail adaptor